MRGEFLRGPGNTPFPGGEAGVGSTKKKELDDGDVAGGKGDDAERSKAKSGSRKKTKGPITGRGVALLSFDSPPRD